MASLGTAYIRIAPDLTGVQSKLSRGLQGAGTVASDKVGGEMKTGLGRVAGVAGKVLKTGLIAAAAGTGVLIAKNIGSAIDRIDTLVAFPRVLQAMGVSADVATAATDKLAKKLKGLPTPLQDGAKGVQALVATGIKVPKATDAFLAFNNAMLAANVETGAAQATFTQLTQSISRGKIAGEEWNSITANMPTVMKALQNESGKTKEELRELYRTDPQKLLDDLVRLNEKGGGGMASLEDQARKATGGIRTAFANMNTAITQALTDIVKKIGGGDLAAGQAKISAVITSVGQNIKLAFEIATPYVEMFISAISGLIAYLQPLIDYVKNNEEVMNILKLTLIAVSAILGGIILAAIAAVIAAVAAITFSIKLLAQVFNVVGMTIYTVWQGIKTGAITAWNGIKSAWSSVTGFFSRIGSSIQNTFNAVRNGIVNAFNSAVSFVRGIPGKIASILSGINLAASGKAMIDSFGNGITSAFGKVKDVVKKGLKAIRDLFPFSPAKEGPFSGRGYTTYSGQALMGDFGKSILKQSQSAARQVNSAMGNVSSAMSADYAVAGHTSLTSSLAGGLASSGNSQTEYNIGTINIDSEVDGEAWLRKLTNNQEITSSRLTPTQGYM